MPAVYSEENNTKAKKIGPKLDCHDSSSFSHNLSHDHELRVG